MSSNIKELPIMLGHSTVFANSKYFSPMLDKKFNIAQKGQKPIIHVKNLKFHT